MGFADSTTTMLFLNRRQSDLEFHIQAILQRKLAIMDECNNISEVLAAAIFQGDNNSAISPVAPLPGLTPNLPLVPLGTMERNHTALQNARDLTERLDPNYARNCDLPRRRGTSTTLQTPRVPTTKSKVSIHHGQNGRSISNCLGCHQTHIV